MIYRIRHRTTYSYDEAVAFTRCVLRLTPRTCAAQTLLESSVRVRPSPSQSRDGVGPFGDRTLTIEVETPHRALIIDARSRVDVHAPAPPAAGASAPWEAIKALGFETCDIGHSSPASFLYPTERAPIAPAITEYARTSFPPGRPIAEAAAELMSRIKRDLAYEPGATSVGTPTAEAFEARRGVCQDFTHIMISGLRGLGLPAAYVSGYIRTRPPPGQPRLEGADATHAWASVWCGEDLGWVGFDPTNALVCRNEHVTVAVGRDYADVAPIDGVVLGSGEQALKVEVDVVAEDEPGAWRAPPDRAATRV